MKPDIETDIEDRFERMSRRLLLVAKLAGLEVCGCCEGTGEGVRMAATGNYEIGDCVGCEGAGVVTKEEEKWTRRTL